MTAKKSPPDSFLKLKAEMEARLLAAGRSDWRKWWNDLPLSFRETLFVNAGLKKADAGGPLAELSAQELGRLVVAAGRYADYCRKAEAWLLKERESRG